MPMPQSQFLAARHFDHRWRAMLKYIVEGDPLGKVIDWFWRIEFQNRGSPHVHMMLWLECAPPHFVLCIS